MSFPKAPSTSRARSHVASAPPTFDGAQSRGASNAIRPEARRLVASLLGSFSSSRQLPPSQYSQTSTGLASSGGGLPAASAASSGLSFASSKIA